MKSENDIREEIKRVFGKLNSGNLRPFEAGELNYRMQALNWVLEDAQG